MLADIVTLLGAKRVLLIQDSSNLQTCLKIFRTTSLQTITFFGYVNYWRSRKNTCAKFLFIWIFVTIKKSCIKIIKAKLHSSTKLEPNSRDMHIPIGHSKRALILCLCSFQCALIFVGEHYAFSSLIA